MKQRNSRIGLMVVVLVGFSQTGDSRPASGPGIGGLAQSSIAPIVAGRRAGTIVSLGASQSQNWSGYNQGLLEKPGAPLGFQSVSGNWVVPTATQHTGGQAEHSAAWVGIGGGCIESSCLLTDQTLIQAGTEHDVDAAGHDSYGAWWEIIPLPQIDAGLSVFPGDSIHVDIHQTLPELWTIAIDDNTPGHLGHVEMTVPYPSDFSTAEWILETPTVIGTDNVGTAALPNLGTVQFSNAKVNGNAANLVSAEAIELVDGNGNALATPSGPSAGGTAFHVCTHASSCS